MELRPLRALVEVVRQGGFSQAAKTIFATQPTVSKAVRQLEDELGMPLLDRHAQPPRLTAAGEIVYRRAVAMLAQRDDLHAELDELKGLKRGVLRLGLPPIGSSQLFAPLFARFRSLYPGIEVQLFEQGSKRLEAMLSDGELDLAGLLAPTSAAFEWQSVREEPMCVLVAESVALPVDAGTVAFAALADQPFVLFEAGFALNPMLVDAARSAGFEPHVVARTSQIDFMVELVAAGLGVGFLPRLMAEPRRRPGVRVLALAEPALVWHMALAWRRGGYLPHAARAWLELAAAAA